MKFFRSGLFVAIVLVFLASIFLTIVYFQRTAPAKPGSDPLVTTVRPAENATSSIPTESIITATRSVQIAFTADNTPLDVHEVPLYSVTMQNDKVLRVEADGELAKSLIDKLSVPDQKSPEPARIDNNARPFARIVRGEPGLGIDKIKTLEALEQSITKNHASASLSINVVISKIEGKEGFESKMREMGFTTAIANYSTRHPGHIDDNERNVNLELASQKIDGLIIPPGGKFSFNKVVGPRTSENGFKKAGVISQGKVIPGLGGGICQVSTTLYRVILMSGMKIDERHNHSIYDGIDYADRGLDAAVSWGSKDFRFTNTLDIPVLIVSKAGKGCVEVGIFAEKKPFDKVVLETRNEVKHDFKTQTSTNRLLKKGEKKIVHPGVTGYSIEAYRLITASGSTRQERLSKDRYLTFNRIEEINN
ncbi:MAG TPA: VanW family protein [Candidatus Rifleibacterium sp.]|nr:VanW family protein [Candidatus Rifleibacterium sp.]HPT44930.1 VanW family protein [Candidatus Rifleibacterium sp.]